MFKYRNLLKIHRFFTETNYIEFFISAKHEVKYAGQVTDFDVTRTYGMGRDGFDNLQTVGLGECTPLPQE